MSTKNEVKIRWLVRRDMNRVMGIEKACFEMPWTHEEFLCALRSRNIIGMVAERDETILGFMVYELHKRKIRVLNIAVAPRYQRQGVGTAMLQRLKDKLALQRRHTIEMQVAETNLAAQLWLKRNGFLAVEVIRQPFDHSDEDALRMVHQKVLDDMPSGDIACRAQEVRMGRGQGT